MPYIKQERREELVSLGHKPKTVGELNYYLTEIILDYLPDKPRYKDYNEVMGVLTNIQFELYRKRIADYEDLKESENGKVY